MELNFKKFIEATGRAAQKIWMPEKAVTNDNPGGITPLPKGTKHLKGVHLDDGFRPQYPAPFKGITAEKLGIRIKKIPKP